MLKYVVLKNWPEQSEKVSQDKSSLPKVTYVSYLVHSKPKVIA